MPQPSEPPRPATEAAAGITTFFTMAYIVIVNPSILATEGTGMPFDAVLTATVLICCAMTLLMGLYAKLPFAVAPGMGLNAFFTYTLVLGDGVPWPVALGIVFWAGVIFLVVSATPLRELIARAIPRELRAAAAAGIGLFLTFIGLQNAGFVVSDPVTLVRLGPLDHRTVLTMGAVLVTAVLLKRGNPLAFLAGISAASAAAWMLGLVAPPAALFSRPDFGLFLQLDAWGALRLALVPALVALLFTDLFDSLSTFIGVSQVSGLVDREGQPLHLRQALIVDSLATLGAGLAGTSPGTTYIESIAGIRMGGRTGLTSVITAACFVPCLFVAPLAASVPGFATTAVLIMVGAAMFQPVRNVDFSRIEEGLPAFATIVLIPLTFSITQGILWGFILHVSLYGIAGRWREVHPIMAALGAIAVGLLVLER
jgi:AGZA family xanthine/uracil permease-like MFS transporter